MSGGWCYNLSNYDYMYYYALIIIATAVMIISTILNIVLVSIRVTNLIMIANSIIWIIPTSVIEQDRSRRPNGNV